MHPHSSTASRNPSITFIDSFFSFKFIVDFLLRLHASLTVSSFHDGPKASLGHDPPAIEQIVPVAPIACRDSGDDLCCLRFSQSVDEVTVSDTFASCDARTTFPQYICCGLTCGTFVCSKLCLRHKLCEPTKHARPDAARLRRCVTCVDVCLCSTVHAVAHACTLNRAMSRGYETTPMHRKLNRAMARDRKCTHSTRNGHAHAYKARRVIVHWHVIIFRQLSWYGVPARQNRTQNRLEEKSRRSCGQRCLRQRCSCHCKSQPCGILGTSFTCF